MSLGATGNRSSSVLSLAVNHLVDSGVPTVVANGNGYAGPFNAAAPAVADGAIAVGSTYSSRGRIGLARGSRPGQHEARGAADNVHESLARGMRIRTVDGVPLKLIVCDGEVAMLPLHGSGSEVGPGLVLRGGLATSPRHFSTPSGNALAPTANRTTGSMSRTPSYCVFCSPVSPITPWPRRWTCRRAPCSGASRG